MIDPGNRTWETLNCGGLYVAWSRGKELTNIHWIGSSICRTRIRKGAYRIDGTLCEQYKKRREWVNHLMTKLGQTKSIVRSTEDIATINKTIATSNFKSDDIVGHVLNILKDPKWLGQSKYRVNCCLYE